MRRSKAPTDLFDNPGKIRRPRYEACLEKAELRAVPARAARIRWVAAAIPKNIAFFFAVDTYFIFEEAKSCYIYGHFVASILTAAAFIEHWLSGNLAARGYVKEAKGGLASAVTCARAHNLIPEILLTKIDHLRRIRNPFAHLKEHGHAHSLGSRSVNAGTAPEILLEVDAQEALSLMYAVATYTFRNR